MDLLVENTVIHRFIDGGMEIFMENRIEDDSFDQLSFRNSANSVQFQYKIGHLWEIESYPPQNLPCLSLGALWLVWCHQSHQSKKSGDILWLSDVFYCLMSGFQNVWSTVRPFLQVQL